MPLKGALRRVLHIIKALPESWKSSAKLMNIPDFQWISTKVASQNLVHWSYHEKALNNWAGAAYQS